MYIYPVFVFSTKKNIFGSLHFEAATFEAATIEAATFEAATFEAATFAAFLTTTLADVTYQRDDMF
jgi:hypothetical protein